MLKLKGTTVGLVAGIFGGGKTMIHNRILVMSLVMLLALSLVAIGCPRPLQEVEPVEEPRILRMAIHSDETYLTPFNYVFGTGIFALGFIYDSLFEMDEDNIPQPWLVEEYHLSEDGLVWTLNLRQDVRWHDGEPFTAYDVEFTYEFWVRFPLVGTMAGPIVRAMYRIDVVDRYTVEIELRKMDPAFLFRPLGLVHILPKHIWQDVTDPRGFINNIGTGPYKLVEYRPGKFYRFVANPNYFKGRPHFDEIIMPIITDPTALFTALKVGEIHAASRSLAAELVPAFEAIAGLEVVKGAGLAPTLLQINNERFPLNLREFRQAMAHAIDLQYLVDVVLLGKGVVAGAGFYHPDSPWHNPDVTRYEGGLEKAAAILDGLGFIDRDGDGFREKPGGEELKLDLLVYAGVPLRIRAAEIMSSWFAEIGLRVLVKAFDPATVDSLVWPGFDIRRGRDYDMAMWGWSPPIQMDPWGPIRLFHSDFYRGGTFNLGGFKNEDVDAVADQMFITTDMEELKKLVFQLQEIIAEELPFIPLHYAAVIHAFWPEAHDQWVFRTGVGIFNKLSLIELEK